jgi:hypothetical protein
LLRTSVDTHGDDQSQAGLTSNVMRLFVEALEQRPDSQVLDVGPVCDENIRFFARRVKRLYVCDLFIRLARSQREGFHPSEVLKHLDYPPKTFDGILLWELPDRLEDAEVPKLVDLCHTLLKADGIIMALNLDELTVSPAVNALVIGDDFRIQVRHQPHLDLRLHTRPSRKFLDMMAPFSVFKSFIYRNGTREFLLKLS